MSDALPTGTELRATRNRRQVLVGGVGTLGALLTGCTPSDPRVRFDGRTPTPTRRPSPEAPRTSQSAAELLTGENGLATLAAGILAGPHRGQLTRPRQQLLAGIRDVHRQHGSALSSPGPSSRPLPQTPTTAAAPLPASVTQLSLEQSLTLLSRREQIQAGRLQRAALAATGFDALLYGSMRVTSSSFRTALASPESVSVAISRAPHRPTAAVSDLEALQSMVRQLHAIVYGYQLALGQLPSTGVRQRRAWASLRAHRSLRNRLERALISRSASVPAAAGAYVPSVTPDSAAGSGRLIRQMETALLPFCGLWLASATKPTERSLALDTLARTAASSQAWGAAITVWPGWSD